MEENFHSGIKETIFSSKKFVCYTITLLIILYAFSGIYSVSQNEVGVLQRFGKVIDGRVMPGIHFAFPWPIDKIDKVPVKTVKRISIEDFSRVSDYDSDAYTFYELTDLLPYCITGDNNIVNISCNLQYLISDPAKYLFYVKNAEDILREITCNVIIHGLAILPVDEVLTYGKRQLENYIKCKVQEEFDSINCGLNISFVELKEVQPPQEVQSSFDDVINSQIDKKKLISEAETYWNEKIPDANAQANKMLEEARSYWGEVIAMAEGDSARFLDKLKRYTQAKEVVSKQIYIEFLQDILSEVDEKYIISTDDDVVAAKIKLLNIKE